MGDFAVTLFETMISDDPDLRVGFRVVAPFGRLVRRGYLALLVRGGPKVLSKRIADFRSAIVLV